MSNEDTPDDDDGGGARRVIPINVEQRLVSDLAVEICTAGEHLVAISRSVYGAARDRDRAELLRLKGVSASAREALVDLEALLADIVG